MIRALSILAAVAALAVSAAPVASAGPNTLKYNGHAGLGTNTKALTGTEAGAVANHTEGTVSVWNNGDGTD